MNSKEEKVLKDMKNHLLNVNIPSDIEMYIKTGIQKGKQKKISKYKSFKQLGLIAACLILTLLGSIRFSPTVAAYVGQLPLLDSLVKLVSNDKGLKLALDNNFIQPLGISDEKEGIRFTVDAMMADESRILLFYTLSNEGQVDLAVENILLKDRNGKPWTNFSISYGNEEEGIIDILLGEGQKTPPELNVEVSLAKNLNNQEDVEAPIEKLKSTWTVKVPISSEDIRDKKEVFSINKTVNVEGQKMHFQKMTIYPTRIALEIEYDPQNSKKIYSFDDLHLVDKKGNRFSTIINGQLATLLSDNKIKLFFQSNYFTKPEEIYIEGSSFGALDKDKLEVLVDVENKELLQAPDDRLTLENVEKSKEGLVLDFKLIKEDEKHFGVFSSIYTDESGEEYHSHRSGSSGSGNDHHIQYYIEDIEYSNPIRLNIDYYPTKIKGNVRIKVK
ncbi:DUF4179 domain-containing protein [Bacillus sp. 31A1R]|uniref:DUF4179 domain-containing protein n=1 Tax=Robertmurraya mangrovi TaxID=3098077 RepID=A0ABU5J492_9BACI|nr:DUF4179 domain-containing protein [Bacillus sp. 31A1R]MDZ5474191.1 DUF4179 domain-containing protein [Bacillus sp. 31A1R]